MLPRTLAPQRLCGSRRRGAVLVTLAVLASCAAWGSEGHAHVLRPRHGDPEPEDPAVLAAAVLRGATVLIGAQIVNKFAGDASRAVNEAIEGWGDELSKGPLAAQELVSETAAPTDGPTSAFLVAAIFLLQALACVLAMWGFRSLVVFASWKLARHDSMSIEASKPSPAAARAEVRPLPTVLGERKCTTAGSYLPFWIPGPARVLGATSLTAHPPAIPGAAWAPLAFHASTAFRAS
mmetsp:Transcript_10971/g.23057  ORF Transcript_10971/g.23057 Transcript_10971/m.23057 type:complete len:236 (+) Transcript_10971:56-763(+)